MPRISLKIVGASGQGYRDYPSLIKGGHASYQLDVSNERICSTETRVNVLIALNHHGLELNLDELKRGGIVLHVTPGWQFPEHHRKLISERSLRVIYFPVDDTLNRLGARAILSNVLLTAFVWSMLDQDVDVIKSLVGAKFSKKKSLRVEISVRDGDGNIVRALKELGGNFTSLKVIGLFDGDLVGRIPEEVLKFSTVLPGDQPIEIIFRGMIEGEPETLQNAIGADDLEAILFGLRGSNHHDWYEGLCRHLGLTKTQLFPTLVQLWLRRDENNLALAQTMVESIMALRVTAK
jgi:Pyruvate/2-oxoacid:ferredoxin oxidoreductase gamma subunit